MRLWPTPSQAVLSIVIADGAGSALYGKEGAQTTCRSIRRAIWRCLQNCSGELKALTNNDVQFWIEEAHHRLNNAASLTQSQVREFACTVCGAVVGLNQAWYFQIGDGAIIIKTENNPYDIVFWPDNGEYANTTFFITDSEFLQHTHISPSPVVPERLALLTDGLQRLAIHTALRAAHSPFFDPMFAQLSHEQPGHSKRLEIGLRRFLNSTPVNERTDDDKTLVLAMRSNN